MNTQSLEIMRTSGAAMESLESASVGRDLCAQTGLECSEKRYGHTVLQVLWKMTTLRFYEPDGKVQIGKRPILSSFIRGRESLKL